MKRLGLRVLVAVLTFASGVAVDRALSESRFEPREAPKIQAAVANVAPVCPAASPLPPPPAPTPNVVVFDYNPDKFNPRGSYFPLERLPKELREFDSFEIIAEPYDSRPRGSTSVQTYSNAMYDSQDVVFSLVTEKEVHLVTASRWGDGIEYRFDGKFTNGNPALWTDKRKPVVRGTLTAMLSGRTIAECVVSFRVEYLGC
jgi:hypothetical protein